MCSSQHLCLTSAPALMEAVMSKLVGPVGLLILALVAGGCVRSTEPGPSVTSVAQAGSSTVVSTARSLDPAPSNWRVFTSVPGGYRLRYPPGWRVKESTGSGGPVLSLLPPKGVGISVLVTSTTPPEAAAANLPNTRCQLVRIDGLEGRRCLDTISMVVSTILQGRERWYVLTTSLRRPARPAGAYDRVVASFRLS
jgi:hypothetical protein